MSDQKEEKVVEFEPEDTLVEKLTVLQASDEQCSSFCKSYSSVVGHILSMVEFADHQPIYLGNIKALNMMLTEMIIHLFIHMDIMGEDESTEEKMRNFCSSIYKDLENRVIDAYPEMLKEAREVFSEGEKEVDKDLEEKEGEQEKGD